MRTRKEIERKLREVEEQDESLMNENVKTSRRAVITTLRWVLDMLDDDYTKRIEAEHRKQHIKRGLFH